MNRMADIKKRFLTISAIAVLCACSGSSFFTPQSNDAFSVVGENTTSNKTNKYSTISGHYLSAAFARQEGDARKALDHLNAAIGLGVPNKSLYIDAYSMALGAGDIELASHFAKKIENRSDNVVLSPSLVQAVVELKAGNFLKAEILLN